MPEHRLATQIHKGRYIQTSDPGAVGAGVEWLDINTTPAIHKKRNAGNSGWDVILDPGLYAPLASPALTSTPTAPTAAAGTSTSQIATTAFVAAAVAAALAGLSWKQAVRAATTANGTLATAFENGDTVDGVTLATGDRILIKNQSSGAENGIYTVNASGAPTRATDADSAIKIVQASVYVSEGTTNADTQWTLTTNAPITLGSTSLSFAQLSSGGGAVSDGDKGDIVVSGTGTVWTIDGSVNLAGNPTTTTQTAGNNSTRIATTAYADTAAAAAGVIAVHAPAGPKTNPNDAGGGWAWLNQGSSTKTVSARDGSVCLFAPSNSANSFVARVKAVPATPYTAIAYLGPGMFVTDNATYGLLVWDGTNAVALQIVSVSGGIQAFVQLSSGFAMTGTIYIGSVNVGDRAPFLAIRDDGTDRKYYLGWDEENMVELHSHARTTGITPTHIGYMVNPRSANWPVKLSVFSWKEQSAAPG